VRFRLVVATLGWPLLTGGRCSQVVVKTDLTVCLIYFIFIKYYFFTFQFWLFPVTGKPNSSSEDEGPTTANEGDRDCVLPEADSMSDSKNL
jgi:hypothetical protein